MRTYALVLFGSIFLAAIGADRPAFADNGEFFGTGIGAAVGGLLGSQIGQGTGQLVSTGIGVAAGGLVGNTIGRRIDEDSAARYSNGKNYLMSDPSPSSYYYYAPNYVAPPAPPPTYVDQNDDTYCRPYSQEIVVDGEVQESFGTACLQSDGTWRIVR